MKLFLKFGLMCALILTAGCSKEQPVEPKPAAKPESPIFKSQIKTLHRAEEVSQTAKDTITEQRQQIDAATQ